MHTLVVMLGVIVYIIIALALVSIITGLIWTVSPLKYKEYIGSIFNFRYVMPMGGRKTGLVILGFGIAGLILGLMLDKEQIKLTRKFGSRT